jgi:hypothetical protein
MKQEVDMRRIMLTAALLTLAFAGAVAAQEDSLTVDEMVFCLGVEDMQPIGGNTQFFESVDKICCFTWIHGATDTTTVTHVWYYGDAEKARVELSVKSASWRTWSCKTMLDAWSGAWRVDVLGPDGTVLLSREFIYKPVSE